MKYLSILFLLSTLVAAIALPAKAQSVAGKWYGIGNVATADATNNYLCEFILTQSNNKVSGYFNYFFRNGYFSTKIKGTFNSTTRQLKLQPVPILFHQTINTALGVENMMTGIFTLMASRKETVLLGSFISDELHAYTNLPIQIRFKKIPDTEPDLKERIKIASKEEAIEMTETTSSPQNIMVQPKATTITETAKKLLSMRRTELVRTLDVADDSVRIDLYDNADPDDDSVSVFYNNELVQYKQILSAQTPIRFYVKVDSVSTHNDLLMYAENLGKVPPNSAIMIITDSKHRYEVPLISTYQKTAAVRLRKVKETAQAP